MTNTAASGQTRNDPTIVRVEEVGRSTISVTDDTHAQVGPIAASELNGETVTFDVIVDSGYDATVKVNNSTIEPDGDGHYSFVVKGNMSVAVTAAESGTVETWYDATMAKGNTYSYDDTTINSQTTIKMGKSGNGGNMTITVASGATALRFYAVAWNGKGGSSYPVTFSGATVTPSSFNPVACSSVSGTAKAFTIDDVEPYFVEVTLSNITAETAITLTSTERVLVFGAQYK